VGGREKKIKGVDRATVDQDIQKEEVEELGKLGTNEMHIHA